MWDHRHWYLPHFSSPEHCLNNVKASHHPLRFLFLFLSLCMGDARGPLTRCFLRPTHRCPGAEEREGEGERGEGQSKSFRHCEETHFAVFSLVCLMNYHTLNMAGEGKKRTRFLYYGFKCEGNKWVTKHIQIWFCWLLLTPEVSVVLINLPVNAITSCCLHKQCQKWFSTPLLLEYVNICVCQ